MAAEVTAGDLAAEFLRRCEATTAFGVASVHNLPLLDAIGRADAMRFVAARGEMGAGHMADGYSRASGRLGVLITSTGPGAASAMPALVEAGFAGTPLLHLTGQAPTRYLERGMGVTHDVPDQLGMLRAACKAAYRVRAASEMLRVLARAATDALTPPMGPVSVEIPIDVQRARLERPPALERYALPRIAPVAPAETDLDALAQRVAEARRPMAWAGSGARHAGGPLCALLERGFGLVTSWAGRGVVPEDHPMSLGALNGLGAPEVEAFYDTVDLMLVVGSRLRGQETYDFSVRLPRRLIQIDIDPAANGRTYPCEQFVRGDSALVLEGLLQRVEGRLRVEAGFAAEFQAMKARAQAAFRESLGPYATFPAQLRAVMPRDAIWARDITVSNSTWGNRLFPVYGPRDSIYPVGAGIGQGLALGLGAALGGGGRKVVVLTGDGGFALGLSEFWTAVQENLDVLVIVMNDEGYGVIRNIQDAQYGGRRRYADLRGPDLEGLARLAGAPYRRVERADEFGAGAGALLAERGPALLEVRMGAIGEHPPYFPYRAKEQGWTSR